MKKILPKYKLSKKTIVEARKKFFIVYSALEKIYPEAKCALNHNSPWELLVATILSAQCTDIRVNMVTPALFKRYPDVFSMAGADLDELMLLVKSTGFYRNKAKNIQATARLIVKNFEGEVPDEMNELLTLPGVARKTANVVLWNAFGKNEGIVVDTHVGRISRRLGLTGEENPGKVEQDLLKLVPRKNWGPLSHLFIDLGRDVCKAPTPLCGRCKIRGMCPWYDQVVSKKDVRKLKVPKIHKI
jgi:endonuclease-3